MRLPTPTSFHSRIALSHLCLLRGGIPSMFLCPASLLWTLSRSPTLHKSMEPMLSLRQPRLEGSELYPPSGMQHLDWLGPRASLCETMFPLMYEPSWGSRLDATSHFHAPCLVSVYHVPGSVAPISPPAHGLISSSLLMNAIDALCYRRFKKLAQKHMNVQ